MLNADYSMGKQILKCESASGHFQQVERPSTGLVRVLQIISRNFVDASNP